MNENLGNLLLQTVLNLFQGKKREKKISSLASCLNRKAMRATCPLSFGQLDYYS